jgi:Flp pilus assembly protein TadB
MYLFRLGSALLLIGLILMVIFWVIFRAGVADATALFAATGLAVLGLLLQRAGRRKMKSQAAARFATMRRLIGRAPRGEEEEEL